MLRPLLALLLLAPVFLAPVFVRAQPVELIPPYGPVQPDRAPLAAAQEVPFAFLLGMDGATPLFVNPARAAHAKRRFIYGTAGPTGTAPVSVSALVGARDTRWLITAENLASTVDDTRTDRQVDTILQPDFSETREYSQAITFASATTGTRGRALLVRHTDFGGYAFGLFGGYRLQTFESLLANEEEQRRVRTQPFQETLSLDFTAEQFRVDRREAYGIGAEVALAGRAWDLAAAVSYQGAGLRESATESRDRQTDTSSDAGGPFEQSITDEVERDARVTSSPQGVGFDVVGTIRAGVSRDDYLFAAASGGFRSGEGAYTQEFLERRVTRTVTGGEVTEDRFLDEGSDRGEADLASRVLRVSLGYVYARKGRGAHVLAGILPTAALDRLEALDANQAKDEATFETFDVTQLGVELPLHVRLPVTKRLALFGGGVYAYTHLRREQTSEPVRLDVDDTDEGEFDRERSRAQSVTAFQSSNRLYGGAVLELRSGLSAQAAFRGDLAEFNRWTVSLGYRF